MALTLFVPSNTDDLSNLASRALDEFDQAQHLAVDALTHAIKCGEALLLAQAKVPTGTWGAWCSVNVPTIGFTTVTKFCRLATYQDQVAAGEFTNIDTAMAYLRHLQIPRLPGGPMRRQRRLDVDEARRLHSEGMNYVQIAEVFNVSDTTVAIHLDPRRREAMRVRERNAKRRRAAEKAALAATDLSKAVRNRGGTPAHAYALLRRTAQVLDKAISETSDGVERAKLAAALGFTHKAEDEIVRALRLERQHTSTQTTGPHH